MGGLFIPVKGSRRGRGEPGMGTPQALRGESIQCAGEEPGTGNPGRKSVDKSAEEYES